MSLVAVAETADLINSKQAVLSETDKEFVMQFAFSTDDKELTNKLIDKLIEDDADKWAVIQKYSVLMGAQPDWIRNVWGIVYGYYSERR